MAVTTSYSGSRRKSAHAAAFAAKQKRQKMIVGVGLVLLVLILAYEVPHTLKMMRGSSTPGTAASTPSGVQSSTQSPPTAPTRSTAGWHALRKLSPHDPFVAGAGGSSPKFSNVSVPSGLHDPFAGASSTSSASTGAISGPTMDASASASTLPKKIVVGSPGAGRAAQTGWIVILASIPSRQGRAAANAFAKKAAGRGVGPVSILDSSKAKPLRSGYWVVYTGPFPTLGAVTKTAGRVHAIGYGSAYVRQLVVYGKK